METVGEVHAVGVGEVVEEAAGWVIFPDKGSIQPFQIRPDNGTLVIIVKERVLDGTCPNHEPVFHGMSEGTTYSRGSFPHSPRKSPAVPAWAL